MPENTAADPGQQTQNQDSSQQSAQSGQKPEQQNTQQSTQQTGDQTSKSTGYIYSEDRSKWIPPHRLQEVSQKYQTAEQKLKELEGSIVERDRKIAALAGVQSPDADSAKEQQIREAFIQMFPQFRPFLDLSEEQLQQLIQMPQHLSHSQAQEQRQWRNYGDKQVGQIAEKVADLIGAEKLDADQQADLRVSFREWLASKASAEIDQTGESPTLDRYESSDATLLDDFVTRYTKNWLTPAQRRATAQTTQRTRPVVATAGRSPVTSTQRPEKFASLDERLDWAAKIAVERGLVADR